MRILITGGAGFIGTNAALRFKEDGHDVIAMDNLTRAGSSENVDVLVRRGVEFHEGDITLDSANAYALKGADVVFHLAAQVAVTTSIEDPERDFLDNICGTFNLLESIRRHAPEALVIYASTNKVYGDLAHQPVREMPTRYDFAELFAGVSENTPLDFHSPYGCSKGAADQYVLDYHRTYGMRTISLRQSCIYGPYQHGMSDQGWLSWFCTALRDGEMITIYGDGKQVRDVLYVDDLVDLYSILLTAGEDICGRAFNVGGGAGNTISLLETIDLLAELNKSWPGHRVAPARLGDQKVYISDIMSIAQATGWLPTTNPREGISKLWEWTLSQKA